MAVCKSQISFLDLPLGELGRQLAVNFIPLGDNNEAAGFFIQTVYDPRPQFAANRRKLLEMVQKCVDQRSAVTCVVGCTGTRVHHHSRRFVDDCQIVVFVDDVECNLLGYGAQWRQNNLSGDCNLFISTQTIRSFLDSIIHQHLALRNKLLHASATGVFDLRGQKLVEAFAGIVSRYRE